MLLDGSQLNLDLQKCRKQNSFVEYLSFLPLRDQLAKKKKKRSHYYRVGIGGQFAIDAGRAAAGRDMGFHHPVGGVSLPQAASIIEKKSDDAQRLGHGPGQRCSQMVRSALHSHRLLQRPSHTPLRSSS